MTTPRRRINSINDYQQPPAPVPGTTFARDASPTPQSSASVALNKPTTAAAALASAPSAAMVPQNFGPTPFRKVGPTTNPAPPPAPLTPGSTAVVPNGNANPLKMGVVTAGQNTSGGASGVLVNGKYVTHDANANLVDAAPTAAPLSFTDQKAKILEMYPQVGVADSQQNKAFLAAYAKSGQNQDGALDLAHSLFAPKTQAQTIAAAKVAGQAQQAKDQQQINADNAATLAARSPQEVAADNAKAAGNQARLDAVGKEVLDANPLSKQIGQAINDNYSDEAILGGIGSAAKSVGGAVKDFFGGFNSSTSTSATSPLAPAATPAPVGPGATGPLSNAAPTTSEPLATLGPKPATTAASTMAGSASFDSTNPFAGPRLTSFSLPGTTPTAPVVAPAPVADPNDPLRKKLAAAATSN